MKPTLNQILLVFLLFLYACGSAEMKSEETAEAVTETVDEAAEEVSDDQNLSESDLQERQIAEDQMRKKRVEFERSKRESQGAVRSRKSVKDSPSPVIDVHEPEMAEPIVVEERSLEMPDLQSKKLAVHCPRKMTYKMSSDVIGFVAEMIDDDLIREMMQQRVADATGDPEAEVSDEDMLIRGLDLYEYIELNLEDADNEGFTIKKIHETDKQKVSANMEGWHWKVTPTTSAKEQQLVLKVTVYDKDGEHQSFNKTYHINIKIESGMFFRNTYALAVENPEWAFATVIIPFLTFLWGRYNAIRSRRRKDEENS